MIENVSTEMVLKMISNRDTSYKLFLMRYLLARVSKDKTRFSFKELSCGMVSEAWEYYEGCYERYTKNDRIFDLVQYVVDSYNDLTVFSSKKVVFDFLMKSNDEQIVSRLTKLMSMVQYRLLVPFIDIKELNGLSWNAQNKKIIQLSCKQAMFYQIQDKNILINQEWISFISSCREMLIKTVDNVIVDEYEHRKNDLCR